MSNKNQAGDALLSTVEVAQILGKSVPTVNRWVLQGRLTPALKAPGSRGAYLFRREDIEALAGSAA